MSRLFAVLALALFTGVLVSPDAAAVDRPNILWITAEDMSPVLGCYGDKYAITPHLDKLAKESVVYDNAFATAPVCSPSRSCIINGLYATTQGTQQMRSAFPIPDYMSGFPSFMRKDGYYTSNNVKTDYNSGNFEDIIKASWNESSDTAHWRKGPKDTNFFSVFNLMTSHQSRTMVWPYGKFKSDVQSKLSPDEIHDPAKAPLPPYYPDTPIVRREVARAADCVTAMDKEVGAILKQLEDDGQAENTIVFFYSDHGNGMPRHKRALLDSGMRVALMIRFPKKYQHLAPSAPGTRSDRLVSFVDFGPTALSLAGVSLPDYMEGKPFLGNAAVGPRKYVYGHRDRVDEVLDLARSVRDKRYLYIRTFMPHRGYNQPTAWPDLGDIRHEIYARTERELMTKTQWHFAGPTRVVEELFDCQEDPSNEHNLINHPDHQVRARSMRKALFDNIRDTKDLGFLPEAYAWDITEGTTPWDLARDEDADYDQGLLVAAASAVGTGSEELLLSNLAHDDPGVRFWGAVGFSARRDVSTAGIDALVAALSDKTPSVRVEAANALCRHGHADKGLPVLIKALEHKNLSVVQHAARQIEMLGEIAKSAVSAMKKCDARMKVIRPPGTSPVVVQPDKDMAMFIGFSTNAFLKKHE
jgi:arylsulfatase A-like enzyme